MNLLSSYASDSDEESKEQGGKPESISSLSSQSPAASSNIQSSPPIISAAPSLSSSLVSIDATPNINADTYVRPRYISSTTTTLYHNPTVEELYQPILGPHPPSKSSSSSTSTLSASGILPNHTLGYVEKTSISDGIFDANYHQFISKGYAIDPGQSLTSQTKIIHDARPRGRQNTDNKDDSSSTDDSSKHKRKLHADPSDPNNYLGPWQPRDEINRLEHQSAQPTEEQLKYREEAREKRQRQQRDEHNNVLLEESSIFYGHDLYDYQHHSYITPASHIKEIDWLNSAQTDDPPRCYLPKKLLHTYIGHKKGVNAIRFFPHTGHLLLSSSMDKSIRIWRTGQPDYMCLRQYNGHAEAVRDICFNYDGTRFLSVSYDHYIKLWDTETGQCISRHTTGKPIPYCAALYPYSGNHGNEALVGQNNKLIVQWDLHNNQVITEYNEHLSTINTVTFIDDGHRFVSSSDDKKIFIWEYGLPVVIKHISEPDMHSIPAITVHPTGRYFLGNSQDNQILIFNTGQNKYKLKRNKRFIGHQSAGYACRIGISNDGHWILCGDGEGKLYMWDWQTTRLIKKMKCHDQVCIDVAWNPQETSKIATCSWDGTIKYWD